ncbi:TPA: DUF4062 domain-containing protein [Klebsiella pneumoniae]|nr:DUF4062 domain-containing protein [Klebsiella pneumoniae]
MAGLRVFVSSTCYDLSLLRSQLRIFIQNLGYEPMMSDYSDLLYDPRQHTHTSCIDEVSSADAVVLIIGSRFGGKVVPEALTKVDFDSLQEPGKTIEFLKKKENISITQLEILKAIESGIPIFTFVDNAVWHDHSLYERNKDKGIIKDIIFPSIEKNETAVFVFEFINFLRQRAKGNSLFPFSKTQDIEETLRKQWSFLFQRLIHEQRRKAIEIKKIDSLTEQFEDLKTAILTSIGSSNEREVARGVVKYRRLIDFMKALRIGDDQIFIRCKDSWDVLLKNHAGIERVVDISNLSPELIQSIKESSSYHMRGRTFLIKADETYFELRFPIEYINNLSLDWEAFIKLSEDVRAIIFDALGDMRTPLGFIRYIKEPFGKKTSEWQENGELLSDNES